MTDLAAMLRERADSYWGASMALGGGALGDIPRAAAYRMVAEELRKVAADIEGSVVGFDPVTGRRSLTASTAESKWVEEEED